MAPRQQSFFDERAKHPQRVHAGHHGWRNNTYYKPNPPVNVPLPKPEPIPASETTKSKLLAFKFQESDMGGTEVQRATEEAHAGKENIPPVNGHHEPNTMNPPTLSSSQKSIVKEPRDCPQTPLGRIPLSQLLPDSDEGCSKFSASPLERVLWENTIPNADAPDPSPVQLRKKRARSSSPLSSSQNQTPAQNDARADTETQHLMSHLKTPRATVAEDLWNRFSIYTSNKHSPSAPEGLEFLHLLDSSSPHVQSIRAQKDSGLRRAVSCIEWSTSAAKRRKVYHDGEQKDSYMKMADEVDSPEKPRTSRVSLLVEKMHQDLSNDKRSFTDGQMPVESSPMARKGDRAAQARHHIELPREQGLASGKPGLSMIQNDQRLSKTPPRLSGKKADASSEFGSDDLDAGLFDAVRIEEMKSTETPPISKVERLDEDPDEFGLSDDAFEEEMEAACKQSLLKGEEENMPVVEKKPADKATIEPEKVSTGPSEEHHDMPKPVEISDEEDFGEDSDFEVLAECLQDQGKTSSQQMLDREHHQLQRFVIKAVAESAVHPEQSSGEVEKVLSVKCEKTKISKVVILRQAWADTPCNSGAVVNVIGKFDHYGQCVIDNTKNMLILHPDQLISSTVVGDSFVCLRKAALQDRIKATSDPNQHVLYGHMLHEIFQDSLRLNQWSDKHIDAVIEKTTTRFLEGLFELNIERSVAIEHLKARASVLQAWAEIFVAAKPRPEGKVKDRHGAQALMSINKLLEVEEHVWSPQYGLKGNIDATVQIILEGAEGRRTLTVPLELKTGKNSSSAHRAQTALYSLLLSDRYDVDIACGILYYMQSSELWNIRTLRHEIVPMIIQRNELAHFIRNQSSLPPMLQSQHTCGKCYAQTQCFVYHKLVDDGTGESSGLGDKFENAVRHLKPDHQTFFRKWEDLLNKEEREMVKFKRELWTMSSSDREKAGRCFGGLILENKASSQEEQHAPKINRFQYTFVKREPMPKFSFRESQITPGEPIVVSDEKGHYALANGYVISVKRDRVSVAVDRRLQNARRKMKDFDPETRQIFSGIMEVRDEDGSPSPIEDSSEPMTYRLDKDEFSNGMALVRNNLVRLMEKEVFGAQSLRRLIVEGMPPSFRTTTEITAAESAMPSANLNADQKAAIQKVLTAKDYALVLGMPGTGKTTTIAHIITALVKQRKSVLLASYTHTAVDNILLKLQEDQIGVFRLGALAKVHPEVQKFAYLAGKPMKTLDELKACYSQNVVATTCLGINHPIFNQRIFDYCIVDEASQITLPVCLGPIRMARTFILVGDHHQLPPLVQNKEAMQGGLDVSLFKMLSDQHPSSVVHLGQQYRMCEDIMTLSNTLIYNGKLKCGTEEVARRAMPVPRMDAFKKIHYTLDTLPSSGLKICAGANLGSCWLRDVLDPAAKACFIDTDALESGAREVLEHGSRITNPCEVTLCFQLVEALLAIGVPASDVGVITLYRSQLALLKQILRHRADVEMHTADRFQGRDKQVIIVSLVRSNEAKIIGELLSDWRRVNVALTRARTKLLVLGSKSNLSGSGNDLLKKFISLMHGKDWIYSLPANADVLRAHYFEDTATQLSLPTAPATSISEPQPQSQHKRSPKGSPKDVLRRGFRVPAKQARLDVGRVVQKRPVLRDIVNDAQ